MKILNLLLLLLFFLSVLLDSSVLAIDSDLSIFGKVRFESSAIDINEDSKFNPSNVFEADNLPSYTTAFIHLKKPVSDIGLLYISLKEISPKESNNQEAFVNEAYGSIQIDNLNIKIGKQRLLWGPGQFFNPSDVINREKDPSQFDRFNELEGNNMLDIAYIPNDIFSLENVFVFNKSNKYKDAAWVTKGQISIDDYDFYLFTRVKKDTSAKPGGGITWMPSFFPNILVYGEFLYLENEVVEIVSPDGNNGFEDNTRSINNKTNYLFGIKWQTTNQLSMSIEAYHNKQNFNEEEFSNYLNYLDSLSSNTALLSSAASKSSIFHNSQNYLAMQLSYAQIVKDINVSLVGIFNAQDQSSYLIPILNYLPTNAIELRTEARFAFGGKKSEFGNFIEKYRLKTGLTLFF